MSDEWEQDAAVLFAEMRAMVEHENLYFARGDIPHSGLRYGVDFAKLEEAFNASMHIVDRLTAERDQAREQLAKLREACEDVPWMLERAAGLYAFEIADVGIDDNSEIRSWREQSQYLRAALESKMGDGKA